MDKLSNSTAAIASRMVVAITASLAGAALLELLQRDDLWAAQRAVDQVRLELVGDPLTAAAAFQEWAQALGQAGIKNVRIRGAAASDKVGIEVLGSPEQPIYVVTGIIQSRDELILPGGRYRKSQIKQIANWLDELARLGPPDRRPAKVAFGLTKQQFAEILEHARQPVGFSTKGLPRLEAIQRVSRTLRLPVETPKGLAVATGDDVVAEEMSELSCGTALACLLRPAGYCLVPRSLNGRAGFAIVQSEPAMEIWPIGWEPPPDKSLKQLAPGLLEVINVHLEKVSASDVISAISQRVKVPVLLDHNALARHGIEPAKAIVNVPPGKITYAAALRRALFQAGLKYELRLDEADKPLLWITTLKPI
jgi:hypothetical protein